MKILVLFTGGTIGSDQIGDVISPVEGAVKNLLSLYKKAEGDGVQFTTLSPYTILSENLSAERVNTLISHLQQAQEGDFDGVIVTHGTDTLHYTAAAVDFSVEKRLPILFVSAAYPLSDRRSNGLENFRAAVRFIQSNPPPKTYIAYQNRTETQVQIHLATRLLGYGENGVDLFSINDAPYALVDNQQGTLSFTGLAISNASTPVFCTYCKTPRVLIIPCHPEDGYGYDIDKYSAVIFSPYHSATLDVESPALKDFCRRAKEKGVPLFVSGATREKTYESATAFHALSLIPLPIARTALFVKCWLAESVGADIKDFVLHPIADEFC